MYQPELPLRNTAARPHLRRSAPGPRARRGCRSPCRRPPPTRPARDVAGRGADRPGHPQPRRRVLPPARREAHRARRRAVDGAAVRAEVLDIVAERGKMQNPVTGSGGMLIGTVAEVGPESTPRAARWETGRHPRLAVAHPAADHRRPGPVGRPESEQVPAEGHAILFERSIAAVLPDDLDPRLALMVMDVCGAPALVARVVGERVGSMPSRGRARRPSVLVLGAPASRARCRSPPPATPAPGGSSASCPSRPRPTCCRRRRAWPTTWSSPTRARRSGWPKRRGGGRRARAM
jgi:hypothetical protein